MIMKCHGALALTCFSIYKCVTQMWQRRHRHQPTWTKIWLMMLFLLWLICHLNPISPKIKRRVSAPVVAAQANKPGLGWRHNKAGQFQTLLNKISAFLEPAMTWVIWSCFKWDRTSDANCPCWCTKLCFCVCILPSVNWDDFNERVLPDLGQVQSGTPESPTSIFLLSQETNRVTWKGKKNQLY